MGSERWNHLSRRDALKLGIGGTLALAGVAGVADYFLTQGNTPDNYYMNPNGIYVPTVPTVDAPAATVYTPGETLDNEKDWGPELVVPLPNVSKQILTYGPWQEYYGMPGKKIVPNMIVSHTTASPGTAQNIRDYYEYQSRKDQITTATQFVVGKDGQIIQMGRLYQNCIDQAWGVANYWYTISVEWCCESTYPNKGAVPRAQYEAGMQLYAWLMKQYNIPLGKLNSRWISPNNGPDDPSNPDPGIPVQFYGHVQLNHWGKDARTDPGGVLHDIRVDLGATLQEPSYE